MVSRSIFRKLPFGAQFLFSLNLALGPYMKIQRRHYATGFSGNTLTSNDVVDVSVGVAKVPYFLQTV